MLAQVRLLERGDSPDALLPRLANEIHGVSRLSRDYLALARPLDSSTESVALRAALERILVNLRAERLAENHPVSFEGDFPSIRVDGPLLERALDNIIRNAFQAMANKPEAGLRIHGFMENGNYVLGFEDSGTGLGMDHPSDVFKPFVSGKPGGTGLGLALTRRILEAMGASIRALDNPQGGAILLISFPARMLAAARMPT